MIEDTGRNRRCEFRQAREEPAGVGDRGNEKDGK